MNVWKNLIYDQYYPIPCTIHKIANMTILYNINNLEIIYIFNKKNLEKTINLLLIDYINSNFIEKITFNNNEILPDSDNDFYLKIENLLNNRDLFNDENNKIIFTFSKINSSIKQYVWFMKLVRYETFDYEEDSFFLQKTIEQRESCLTLDELQEKLKQLN